jgi:hypothetical protein
MDWKTFVFGLILLWFTHRNEAAAVFADVKKNGTFDQVVQDAFEVTKEELDKIVYAGMENSANDYEKWQGQPRQFKRG